MCVYIFNFVAHQITMIRKTCRHGSVRFSRWPRDICLKCSSPRLLPACVRSKNDQWLLFDSSNTSPASEMYWNLFGHFPISWPHIVGSFEHEMTPFTQNIHLTKICISTQGYPSSKMPRTCEVQLETRIPPLSSVLSCVEFLNKSK